jgi:hypothetical protein
MWTNGRRSGSPVTLDRDASLRVLMDEYKLLTDDIARRVQLQQQNANVIIVLLTAFTGYLFNYWKDHTFAELRTSEVACLIVIAPILGMVLVWRHVDHDSNIIEKAEYIVEVIRPRVVVLTGDYGVMSFESWLRSRRVRRVFQLTPLIVFGMEHVSASAYVLVYGALGWYLRLTVPGHAGSAEHIFDLLLYVGTVLYVISVYMLIVTTYRYTLIGQASDLSPDTQPSNQVDALALYDGTPAPHAGIRYRSRGGLWVPLSGGRRNAR